MRFLVCSCRKYSGVPERMQVTEGKREADLLHSLFFSISLKLHLWSFICISQCMWPFANPLGLISLKMIQTTSIGPKISCGSAKQQKQHHVSEWLWIIYLGLRNESYLVPTETTVINEDLGCMLRMMCRRVWQAINILFLLQHFPHPYLSMGGRDTPLPRGTWDLVKNPLGTWAGMNLLSHGTLIRFCWQVISACLPLEEVL